jgi:hypothetical protein
MMRLMNRGLFLIGFLVGMMSCANIMTPDGGPRDTKAPQLKRRSVSDSSLGFQGGKIQFEFDEFIQIKDAAGQIQISPLVSTNLKAGAHKRTLTLEIPDSLLLPSTTYQLSLGKAVVDLHEGNPAEEIRFTFSTGNFFDSLSIRGKVFESETGLPDTAAWIVLHPANRPDSAISYEKPLYAVKNKMGVFELLHLPGRAFKIYALRDLNNNLKYDAPGERIAFSDSNIVPGDSLLQVTLYTFFEKDLDSSKKPISPKPGVNSNKSKSGDATFTYVLNVDTSNLKSRSLDITQGLKFTFNQAVKNWDETKIRLYQGSILDASVSIVLDSTRKILKLSTDWQQDVLYQVQLLEGFVQDTLMQKMRADTFMFRSKRKSDYGYFTLLCPVNQNVVAQLMLNNQVIREQPCRDTILNFTQLNPGSYQLRLLKDENGNGQLDAGSWKQKRQPENVELIPNEILIKANWEQKLDIRKKPKLKKKDE